MKMKTLDMLKKIAWNVEIRVILETLTLGLRTKQGLARLRAKREAHESYLMLLGVQKSVKEWTFTLPNELPFWELESRWTPESS
jgi:hypothetical protein